MEQQVKLELVVWFGRKIPGSILKIEDDNYEDPETRKRQRQLWCYAISAKRYVLFLRDSHGVPDLLRDKVNNTEDRWSEHGLGYLLNPTDPEGDDREWIAQAWLRIVRKALGLRTQPVQFGTFPAVGRTSVSSPWVMRAFKTLMTKRQLRELSERTGLSLTMLRAARAGRKPHPKNRAKILAAVMGRASPRA